MKSSMIGLFAAMSALQRERPQESQAARLARMTGSSEEDVERELARMGMLHTGDYRQRVPPKPKADPVKKKKRKAVQAARRKNRS